MKTVLNVFLFILLLTIPAISQAATADSLRDSIQASLERKQSLAALRGIDVVYEGQLLVEDAGGYYAVTLPDITIKSGNRTIDLGIISLNAAPAEQENVWRIRLALPTPMRFTGDDGNILSRAYLPQQNIEAFWHSKADIYLNIDASFNDVRFEDFENKMAVKFGGVSIRNAVTGLDVDKITQHLEKLENWSAEVKQNGTNIADLDPETLNSMFDMYMSDYIRSQDLNLTFENMVSEKMGYDHATEKETLEKLAEVQKMEFSTGFIVKDNNMIDIQGKAGAAGMISQSTQDFFSLGAPDTFETSFSIYDIPEKEVSDALKEYFQQLLLGSDEKEEAASSEDNTEKSLAEIHEEKLQHETNVYGLKLASDNAFVISVIEAAVKAGSKMGLSLSVSEADQYGIRGELNVEGDEQAKHGGKGNLLLTLKGYDKIKNAALEAAKQKLAEEQAKLPAPENPEQPVETSEAVEKQKSVERNTKLVFTILEMIGKSAANQNGGTDITFDARVGADGAMNLNGIPVQQVVSMVLPALMMNSMGDAMTLQPAPDAQTPNPGNPNVSNPAAVDPTLGQTAPEAQNMVEQPAF